MLVAPQNLKQIQKLIVDLSEDMLNTMKACLSKDPKRWDIVKEYGDYFHERIIDFVRDFWDT